MVFVERRSFILSIYKRCQTRINGFSRRELITSERWQAVFTMDYPLPGIDLLKGGEIKTREVRTYEFVELALLRERADRPPSNIRVAPESSVDALGLGFSLLKKVLSDLD